MDFKNIAKVEYSNQRILLTEQLADFYGCEIANIKKNFNANKNRFVEGRHFFKLEGTDLKAFKDMVTKSYPVNDNNVTESYPVIGKNANVLYLWTKRGAARHAKMLSTEKAWEVFELLEDTYFESTEKTESLPKDETQVAVQTAVKNKPPVLHKMLKDIKTSYKLMGEVFKVQDGIALAKTISIVERFNGVELYELKELIPPAEHEIGRYTPTQLAKKFGLKSAQAVNQILLEKGLQEKDGHGGYILTEKGKTHGEAMPYERNGHTGYQIKWTPEVMEFFK